MLPTSGRSRLIVIFVALSSIGILVFPSVRSLTSSHSPHVSIVTWNLLAPLYARPEKYPLSKQHLDWSIRERRIVKKLASIDADVICLQEVQVDLWDRLLAKLKDHGYHHGVLQGMKRDHPVANAILVRDGLTIVRTESRSRALIAVIVATSMDENSKTSSSPLYLANVHLDAGFTEDADKTRFHQVRSLCKRLKNQVSKDIGLNGALSSSNRSPTVVITGDCNILRGSPLHNMLQTGTTLDANGMEITVPLLPLHNAYLKHPPPFGPPLQMSYRSGHLLDYVWVSENVDVVRTMQVLKEAEVGEPKPWPSADIPSDHIPIGVSLSWPNAPLLPTERKHAGWQQQDHGVNEKR